MGILAEVRGEKGGAEMFLRSLEGSQDEGLLSHFENNRLGSETHLLAHNMDQC